MLAASFDTFLGTFHLALDFSAQLGKTTVLLGESGAGKTTVLRLLTGLLDPERGRIALDGVTYFESARRIRIPPQERPFGYVFQDYVLFPHLTVFENVAFGLRAQHLPRSVIVRRVGDALEQVHLEGLDRRRPIASSSKACYTTQEFDISPFRRSATYMDEIQQDDSSPNGIPTQPTSLEEQQWTDQGNSAVREGDYEAAATAFERAVEANPNDARARYNLALALQYRVQEGDSELAIAGYRRAIDLDPELIEAYINLGHLYGEIGMYEESLETFQQALELDDEDDELYVSLGDTYRALNLYQDAIQTYRQALILNPDNTAATENVRDVRERVNDQLRRIMEQERRVDEDPSDTTRYSELVSLYLDMRRYDEALSVANQMLALDPEDRTSYDMLASVYEQMGDRDQAAEMYTRIVEMAPDDAEAWEHLGTWRALQNNTAEAITAYDRAVQLDPNRSSARFSLAETTLEAERFDDAQATYQGLVDARDQLLPDDLAAAYAGLAESYNALGRYDEAISTAQTLLAEFEHDPEGYYQLATAYDELGRHDEAIENYQNAIESDPLNAAYYNDLADTLREVKRYDEALDMAQQAIALDPSMTLAYETLSQIYREMGRSEEAAAALAQADALRSARE